jgi:hypothetical protein
MSLKHGQYICDFVSLQQNFLQWALIFFHFNGFKKNAIAISIMVKMHL